MLGWSSSYSLKSFWIWCIKLCSSGLSDLLTSIFHKLSNALPSWMETVGGAIFRSLQRCWIRFKSGFWLVYSRIFRESHSCIVFTVDFGLCWKVNPRPSLRSWALWNRYLFKISLFFAHQQFLNPDWSLSSCCWKAHPWNYAIKFWVNFLTTLLPSLFSVGRRGSGWTRPG